jgi:hypothetical protein
VREIVRALADPKRGGEARALPARTLWGGKAEGLKAVLASAPLEGVYLSRDRCFGRDVWL